MKESATEWIASESIELDPVKKNATNLAMAIPMLAQSAAMTALTPPSVLTAPAPCPPWWRHPIGLQAGQ